MTTLLLSCTVMFCFGTALVLYMRRVIVSESQPREDALSGIAGMIEGGAFDREEASRIRLRIEELTRGINAMEPIQLR